MEKHCKTCKWWKHLNTPFCAHPDVVNVMGWRCDFELYLYWEESEDSSDSRLANRSW